jgi:hypothetical protein
MTMATAAYKRPIRPNDVSDFNLTSLSMLRGGRAWHGNVVMCLALTEPLKLGAGLI